MNKLAQASLLLLLSVVHPLRAAPFGFDDIDFWVGEGVNRAALVFDWRVEGAEPLAWGFRWDGAATGRDMLLAVVTADPRLFVKLGGSTEAPTMVFGVGYDTDDNGAFALSDGTPFDERGVGFGPAPFFVPARAEGGDLYAEGWQVGFWHYATSAENPYADRVWESSVPPFFSRPLADGAWDGWTFESPITFTYASFPASPDAAPAPVAPGDYNRDGAIDAADYTVWRDALGQNVLTPGAGADGDLSGAVDVGDYAVWRGAFASQSSSAASTPSVPEPASLALILVLAAVRQRRFFHPAERCI